jgi:hypothetical protein
MANMTGGRLHRLGSQQRHQGFAYVWKAQALLAGAATGQVRP